MKTDTRFPEHAKFDKIQKESQTCGLFLDTLISKYSIAEKKGHEHDESCYGPSGHRICGFRKGEMVLARINIEAELAEFFDIDQTKLYAEKDEMLRLVRAGQL